MGSCDSNMTQENLYTIKSIQKLDDEDEFEAVFEFDEENNTLGLSEDDIKTLELLRDEDLLIIGSDEEDQASGSVKRFQDVIVKYAEDIITKDVQELSENELYEDEVLTQQDEKKVQRRSDLKRNRRQRRTRCSTPLPQDIVEEIIEQNREDNSSESRLIKNEEEPINIQNDMDELVKDLEKESEAEEQSVILIISIMLAIFITYWFNEVFSDNSEEDPEEVVEKVVPARINDIVQGLVELTKLSDVALRK